MVNVANNFETDIEIDKIIDTCIEIIKVDEVQPELDKTTTDAVSIWKENANKQKEQSKELILKPVFVIAQLS